MNFENVLFKIIIDHRKLQSWDKEVMCTLHPVSSNVTSHRTKNTADDAALAIANTLGEKKRTISVPLTNGTSRSCKNKTKLHKILGGGKAITVILAGGKVMPMCV